MNSVKSRKISRFWARVFSEGCLGQLPEIYDGAIPAEGKGCFAQAWSVGEMLRVLEAVERIENE